MDKTKIFVAKPFKTGGSTVISLPPDLFKLELGVRYKFQLKITKLTDEVDIDGK